jgi:Na+-translocating ferredoxin:NAD+ oxidoreductase RnfD subunit
VLGGITVYRAKVWHVTLVWFAAFVAFAALRAIVIDGGRFLSELAPITGPMYTMFMFFMITDPRTIVRGKGLQIAIAITVAAVECVIRLLVDWHVLSSESPLAFAPPMFALFFVGPLALALQLWLDPPRPKTEH